MVKSYTKDPSRLKPYALPDGILLAMGRIVRDCAEIEDIITIFLRGIAGLDERQFLILLGRTPVSQKIAFTRAFAKSIGGRAHEICAEHFDSEAFKVIFRARNIAAHGVLLGETEDGLVCFRTATVADVDADSVSVEAVSVGKDYFELTAAISALAVPELERILNAAPSRTQRREQGLLPRKQPQPIRTPSVKHLRQRKAPKASKRSEK